MTIALLVLLNVQVAVILVVYALPEKRDARRYRSTAKELLGDRLDVDLAIWAKDQPRSVVASEVDERKRDQNGQSDQISESWIQSEHRSIVQNGADSA